MSEVTEKIESGTAYDGTGIVGFSLDDLLEAIWTPPPEPEKNSSRTATVLGPLKAANACTYTPD